MNRKSQVNASSKPPPSACPLMAAMVGIGQCLERVQRCNGSWMELEEAVVDLSKLAHVITRGKHEKE